jgi:hypothetical protein
MTKIQNADNTPPNAGEAVGQQELSSTAGGNIKWHNHFGRQSGGSYKAKLNLLLPRYPAISLGAIYLNELSNYV